VHGITSAMLAGQPTTAEASVALLAWVYQRCRAAGGNSVLLMAHNARRVRCRME
jgi:hypothetical protein